MAKAGRSGSRYRRLCDQVRRRSDPCWLCHLPIHWDAQPRTRWSFSLDHAQPLSRGGDVLDPGNARTAHYGCNSARGNRTIHTPHTVTSRAW